MLQCLSCPVQIWRFGHERAPLGAMNDLDPTHQTYFNCSTLLPSTRLAGISKKVRLQRLWKRKDSRLRFQVICQVFLG